MGRKSQERMTGKTYEERKAGLQRFGGVRRLINRISRLNKEPPRRFANVRRHDNASLNPKLIKTKG